jgi:hypothetical protein
VGRDWWPTRLPAGIAAVDEIAPDPVDGAAWVRVQLRAERLDWVPLLLARLERPFVTSIRTPSTTWSTLWHADSTTTPSPSSTTGLAEARRPAFFRRDPRGVVVDQR